VSSPPPGRPAQTGDGAEPPLVLVVDDDERNAKLARDVLRAAAFRTLAAATGAEAIALAGEYLPDVILMDLRLPDMDGTDAVRALAAGARTARIPVVALSALRLGGDDAFLLAAGFAGGLEKPISVEEFPGQVRRYCTRAAT
jgi:two-component system cell cycle response regulator DivK